MAGGVAAGFGLIGGPEQIWLAVAPVDMRRGGFVWPKATDASFSASRIPIGTFEAGA